MSQDTWPTTQLSLLLRVKDPQSEQAWGDFVGRYRPPMVRLIRDVFRLQDAEAEDIAQNVLLKLVRAMKAFEYDPDKKFRAWVRTITRNAVRDALRSQQAHADQGTGDTRVRLLLAAVPEPATDEFADALSSEIHLDILRDAERLVQRRVEARTWSAYRAAADGQPAREIASATGMSTAAVYKAKSKVTRMIREEIAQMLAEN